MVFPKNPTDSIDIVLEHVEYVIGVNIEKEKKLMLLKAKIEELKVLFTDKSLGELEKLKFVIENIKDPTLKDITFPTPPIPSHRKGINRNIKNGIELPPKEKSDILSEKEEN